MPSLSKVGVVQVQGSALAQNLKLTAAQVHQYEPGIQKAMAVTEAAVGDSHQSDVVQLREIALASHKANALCGDTLASCAQRIQTLADAT